MTTSTISDKQTMIARLRAEGAKPAPAIAKKAPSQREGTAVHPGTISRWALKGVKLADGRTVRLEAFKVGRVLMTSEAALERFFLAQNADDAEDQQADPPPRSAAARNKASRRAEAELLASGC